MHESVRNTDTSQVIENFFINILNKHLPMEKDIHMTLDKTVPR